MKTFKDLIVGDVIFMLIEYGNDEFEYSTDTIQSINNGIIRGNKAIAEYKKNCKQTSGGCVHVFSNVKTYNDTIISLQQKNAVLIEKLQKRAITLNSLIK